jgi:hypothetical protein
LLQQAIAQLAAQVSSLEASERAADAQCERDKRDITALRFVLLIDPSVVLVARVLCVSCCCVFCERQSWLIVLCHREKLLDLRRTLDIESESVSLLGRR